jgi:imidazolonepropionase-like amidohydrolase
MLRTCLPAALGLAALAATSPTADAAPVPGPSVQDGGATAEDVAPTLLIRAERLIVRPGHELEGAEILVRDGRIRAVGTGLEVPEGAQVVEGPVVCAGFIDSWSRIGLDDASYGDGGTGPATRTVDAVDPYIDDHHREAVLAAGVVAARVQAGARARVGGVGAVVVNHPAWGLERLVLSGDACVSAQVEGRDAFERLDSVERLAGAIEQGARYRQAQLDFEKELAEWEAAIAKKTEELEDEFKKAKKKREKAIEEAEEEGEEFEEEKYKEDRRPSAPRFDADSEVMARVASGEVPIVIEAHRAGEIRALLNRMQKYPLVRWVLAGASDAHVFAEELAEARVPVLIAPQRRGLGGGYGVDEFELAGRLQRAGVSILLGSDGSTAGRDLPLLAALAVGHGLDRDAALAAITSAPARAFDLSGDTGTVEVGKQAHLLVLSGDPLDSATRVETVVLQGEVVLER